MSKHCHCRDTLAKFAGENIGDSNRWQKDYVLAFTTLGSKTPIESLLLVSHKQRQVYYEILDIFKYWHCHWCFCQNQFASKNVGDCDRGQKDNILAFTTLCSKTQIESFLFVSHRPRQVYYEILDIYE